MKHKSKLTYLATLLFVTTFTLQSCEPDISLPYFHNERITIYDDYSFSMNSNIYEQDTDNYSLMGTVTLYDTDGGERDFAWYRGKKDWEQGCNIVIYCGKSYNLDRNKWVYIDGKKYRATNIH